jgi:hypothetical protein
MSMMMPPDPGAVQGLPGMPPGGGGMPPPMDALNQGGPLPADQGIGGLLAALGGGGGAPPGMGGPEMGGGPPGLDALGPGEEDTGQLDAVGHIQQAMKHLMMAIAKDDDEERGLGVTKGMGALQGILAGEQKKSAQLSALGG